MPGGGTPALAPMNAPGLVAMSPPSVAYAGENATAAIPADASRVLVFIIMYPPCGSLKMHCLSLDEFRITSRPSKRKRWLSTLRLNGFSGVVAKLHTSLKPLDRT